MTPSRPHYALSIVGYRSPPEQTSRHFVRAATRALPWFVGVALGVIVVGWPWGSGALLNLDLVVVGDLDVPDSLWSLGPEVPRRAPLVGIAALFSPPLSGLSVMKLWMVAVIAVAGNGMYRHLAGTAAPIRAGAAVAFALSPYLLTRIGVGHLALATAAALVPWSASAFLRPLERWRATVLWAMAYALCGYFGLVLAAPQLVVGFAGARRAPSVRQLAILIGTQAPWLAPALFAARSARPALGSDVFPTDVGSMFDVSLTLIGYGFWQPTNQVGVRNLVAFTFTVVLLAVALIGLRWSPSPLRRQVAWAGALGAVVTLLSATPLLEDLYDGVTDLAPFGPWRDSHRLAALTVFALISLGARGFDAVALDSAGRQWIAGTVLAAGGVALVAPSLWGLDSRVERVPVPDSWAEAAAIIDADPGTTLALPWNQYFDVRVADGRRAHTPIPFLVGGDVVFNHELQLAGGGRVSRDDREDSVPALLAALRLGEPIEQPLRELGIRWIVALPDLDRPDQDLLRDNPSVEVVIDEPELALFETRAWVGTVVTESSAPADLDRYGPWIARVASSEPADWNHLYEPGWIQGFSGRVSSGRSGTAALPGGSGVLWNWIAIAVALVDGVWLVAGAVLARRELRARSRVPRPTTP